ncbi:hypothetical protein WDW86_14705, partial [Bdellovibrionota bacterium FG-2]
MKSVRFGISALVTFVLAVSLSACGDKKLTEAQTVDAAKGVSSIKTLLSSNNMSGMLKTSQKKELTALALRQRQNFAWVYKSGLAYDTQFCTSVTAEKIPLQEGGECALSCAGSNSILKMSCTIANTITSTCKDKTYKFSKGTLDLAIDMTDLTQSGSVYTGSLGLTMEIGGTLEGSDIGSGALACKYKSKVSAEGDMTTSQKMTCANSEFNCSFDGKDIPCEAMEQNQDACDAAPAPTPTPAPSASPTPTSSASPAPTATSA